MDVVPFDWQRMLLGDHPPLFLLEIIFRSMVVFVFLLMTARFMGKRAIAEMSPFEFIVVIALGAAAGDPMFYADVPILHGIVAVGAFVVMERMVQVGERKSRAIQKLVSGEPRLMIYKGRLLKDALVRERLNEEDLFMDLRVKGIQDLGEVACAYLEDSGELSVFKADKPKAVKSILPTKA